MAEPLWRPLAALWSSPSVRRSASDLLAAFEPAGAEGGYRAAGLEAATDSLLARCEGDRVVGLAAARREDNDDHEIAAVAGDVAIVVPVLVLDRDAGIASRAVQTLIRQLRAEHGDHRITVHQPVGGSAEVVAGLRAAGFRPDSALSVRNDPGQDGSARARVEPASGEDAEEVAALFRDYLRGLSSLSPFVQYRQDAADHVRDRIRTCQQGVTADGTRVGIARSVDGRRIVGVVESSLGDQPESGLVAWLPAGSLTGIDWITVAGNARGRGLGRSLAVWATAWPDGVPRPAYSYHLLGAGSAAPFWSRLGFLPRWSTYELGAGDR